MSELKSLSLTEAKNNIKSRGQGENKKRSKVRKESFALIPGWAVCELGLKGNELLIYSIIFGFSQEENQTFRGSLRYLMDWTALSKPAVITILKTLVKKGLIKKIERFENNVKFCEYYATRLRGGGDDGGGGDGEVPKNGKEDDQTGDEQPGKETLPETSSKADTCSTLPVVKKLNQGGKETLPNNIEDNIDIFSINSERINTSLSVKKPIEDDRVKKKKSNQKKNLENKVLEKEFQSIWDTYPNKKGKAKAFVAYVKARKNSTTFEEVKLGVENYNKEIRTKKIDPQYIKHGDTWFRNSCWEDEYEIRSSSNQNTSSSYNLDDYYKNMDTFLDTEPQEVTTNPNAVLENLFRECDVDYRVEQRKKQLEQEKKQKSKDKKPNIKHNQPSNCDQKKIDEAVKKLRDERNTSSLLPEITWQKIAEDVKYLSEKNVEEDGGILAKIFPGDKEYIDTS